MNGVGVVKKLTCLLVVFVEVERMALGRLLVAVRPLEVLGTFVCKGTAHRHSEKYTLTHTRIVAQPVDDSL